MYLMATPATFLDSSRTRRFLVTAQINGLRTSEAVMSRHLIALRRVGKP